MLLLLLSKFAVGLIAGVMLGIFYDMHRKKRIYPWIYFGLGLAGYNMLSYWTYGLLRDAEIAMTCICLVGMFVAQAITAHKLRKRQKRSAERLHQLCEAQSRWVYDEINKEELNAIIQMLAQELEQEQMLVR